MWILLICLVMLVFAIIGGTKDGWFSDVWVWLTIGFGVLTLLTLTCFIGAYTHSIDAYGTFQAYKNTAAAYQQGIIETNNAVVKLDKLGLRILDGNAVQILPDLGISVENLKQSTNTSERIKEFRDYQQWYYETLGMYREYNKHWFTRQWIAKMPDDLKGE